MSSHIGADQDDAKTRNDLSVEAIVKLTEQLYEEDGIAIKLLMKFLTILFLLH